MHNAFIWSSIIAGFLSGALWLYASGIKVPINLVSGFGGSIGGLPEMSNGLKKQTTLNGYAAVTTAIAAALQAFAQIFP
ncbi:MAG TPA: hypothetical protein VKB89_30005 [Xanthobacteraceae bacterium]|nr:hypothetical protein [Xanthobacteraceae bacterium]